MTNIKKTQETKKNEESVVPVNDQGQGRPTRDNKASLNQIKIDNFIIERVPNEQEQKKLEIILTHVEVICGNYEF